MRPLAIQASGMRTPVGLHQAASCAAIRCGLHAAAETHFIGAEGDWLMGSSVPMEEPLRGIDRLIALAASAIQECLLSAGPLEAPSIPLLLGIPEPSRPGRITGLDHELLPGVEERLGVHFHPESQVLPMGRVSAAHALRLAEKLVHEARMPACIIAATDTFLVSRTLSTLSERHRLLDGENSNGFIPGEAGAAILVGRPSRQGEELHCLGLGFGKEPAPIGSGKPLRGDGLVDALRGAFRDMNGTYDDVQYRIADVNGEQYGFKEAQLAIGRTLRGKMKPRFDLWHPADSIGEVGAAIGPCVLGVALEASRKGYAPGSGVLCHFGNDDGRRAAVILKWMGEP